MYDTYSPWSLPWYWLTLQLVQCFLAKSLTKSQPSCFVLVLQNILKNTINQFDAREFRDCFVIIIQSYKTKYILFIPLCSRRALLQCKDTTVSEMFNNILIVFLEKYVGLLTRRGCFFILKIFEQIFEFGTWFFFLKS